MSPLRQDDWRLTIHEVLPSTSDHCRALAAAGEAEGACALALRQTAGRGSRGRDWQSGEGNLHLSVLLRPGGAARHAGQWSLLAAVALADALMPLLPEPGLLTLKWPNDVRLGGRKLAGVLLDSAADAGGALAWLVIGFGVNLAAAPRLPGVEVAALAEVVHPPAPEALAPLLLGALGIWRQRFAAEGFGAVREAWLARGPAPGSPVTLRVAGRVLSGTFAGLAADGGLRMATEGRVQTFATGEVLG
ncbi:MAG: biotin--[acetyl-CoA-carboxylase] ligase [Alphaproteobacteria bacterium]|nr:biotin--[acetyl-CoA-carboxylase] ligase [Alphaproteobacteria bacterium]